jgi:hypothetical protein
MKIINTAGEEIISIRFSTDEDANLCALFGIKDNAIELELPKAAIAFENTSRGLLVHAGFAEIEGTVDVLMEYDDIKALRSVPGKGLVSFALKAFR